MAMGAENLCPCGIAAIFIDQKNTGASFICIDFKTPLGFTFTSIFSRPFFCPIFFMLQHHPYPSFIPPGARTLIIGSVPPGRFCLNDPDTKNELALRSGDFEFYYGSEDNAFWSLLNMASPFGFSRAHAADMPGLIKAFLTKQQMGITDVYDAVWRTQAQSALDADIDEKQSKKRDLKAVLKNHSEIALLLYTSDYVKGVMSRSGFITGKEKLSYHAYDVANRRTGQIDIGGKMYRFVTLYSPSPTALRGLGAGGAEKRAAQYQEVFGREN